MHLLIPKKVYNGVDIVRFEVHTPHNFILPQSTQQWGNMSLYIKGMSLLIGTSPCASLDDVRFYVMQDLPFGSLHYALIVLTYYVPKSICIHLSKIFHLF